MEYTVRPYRKGEEVYVADAQRRIYSEEYRWGDAFIRYAVKVAMDFAEKEKNDREELWVAYADGKLVGCIMLCETDDPTVGQLRLFLVEKEYRRYGIGGALIKALMEKAKEAKYEELILWTASPLTAAIRHYERLGFRVTEEKENDEWSLDGEPVTEVKMTMKLK